MCIVSDLNQSDFSEELSDKKEKKKGKEVSA